MSTWRFVYEISDSFRPQYINVVGDTLEEALTAFEIYRGKNFTKLNQCFTTHLLSHLKSGDKFYTFEEFMALPDAHSSEKETREHTVTRSASEWLAWYLNAKQSFETYGVDGPPVGTTVITLVNGHCGLAGQVRTFDGDRGSSEMDKNYFAISYQGGAGTTSLVYKHFWWREIKPI